MEKSDAQSSAEQILHQRASQYKHISLKAIPDTEEHSEILQFVIDDQVFGCSLSAIENIQPVANLLKFPKQPPVLLGLYFSNGRVVSLIDLGYLITGHPQSKKFQYAVALGQDIAFAVQEIRGIEPYNKLELEETFPTIPKEYKPFVEGIYKGTSAVLNVRKILNKINQLSFNNSLSAEKEAL